MKCSVHLKWPFPHYLTTHLSRKKSAVLELPQKIGNEKASQHEAHGQQGCVGVRWFNCVNNNCCVSGCVVINYRLLHSRVPGVFYRWIHVVVVHNQRMILEYLQNRGWRVKNIRTSPQRYLLMTKWMFYPPQLGECFIDEDKGDKDGEDFLCEAGDEAHQEAAFKSHDGYHNNDQPHSDPHPAHNVLDLLRLAELNEGNKQAARWDLQTLKKTGLRAESTYSIEGLLKH